MGIRELCFKCEGVFNVQNNHRQARDNLHAICECAYHMCFSANVWASNVVGITWALISIRQVKC